MSPSVAQHQLTSWAIKLTLVQDKEYTAERVLDAKKLQRISSGPGELRGIKTASNIDLDFN